MPNLNRADEGEDAERGCDEKIAECRETGERAPVHQVGERAAEKADGEKRHRLRQTGEPEQKRGAGELVNLIEILRLAHLVRRRDEKRRDEQKSEITVAQRRPWTDGCRLGVLDGMIHL